MKNDSTVLLNIYSLVLFYNWVNAKLTLVSKRFFSFCLNSAILSAFDKTEFEIQNSFHKKSIDFWLYLELRST